MNNETIVAVFDADSHADAAIAELHAAGIPDSDISRHAGGAAGAVPVKRESGFWASLFGGEPDRDAEVYDRSMQAGACVVVVRVADADAARVTDILEKHDPADIEERAAQYGVVGTTSTAPGVATAGRVEAETAIGRPAPIGTHGGDTVELAEEQLAVGKRAVNRGTTRIRRYVVETPVSEDVTLREEHVTLDRRPVDRPVAAADFSDKTIEMTETGEEVLVTKTARVVEEVALRKDTTERVETVHDTVRKHEVDIQQDAGLTKEAVIKEAVVR